MKRAFPWDEHVDVISSDESSSSNPDVEVDNGSVDKQSMDMAIDQPAGQPIEDEVFSRAKMYQEFMNQIPIPTLRGSLIPFDTWMGLARSIKQLYDQPLHYLTNVLVKQWDQLRVGTKDESRSLDSIIHPVKAEASIWLIEEVHRKTTSPHHISKLWLSDPMHHAFVDSIIPTNMKDALQCL